MDAFQSVADWHHFAILSLFALDGFRPDAAWIGKALGISEREATSALERLKRLKFLEESGGKLKRAKEYLQTTDGVPSTAIRHFHKQILEKAMAALEAL